MDMIGSIIAKARENKGLNQSELARQLGVTPQSVQAWESHRSIPRSKMLPGLSLALGIPMSVLMGEGQPNPGYVVLRDMGPEAEMVSGVSVWDETTPLDDGEIYIPLLREVELAAGSGKFVIEEVNTGRLRFFKSDLRRNNVQFSNAKCVIVRGNSMEPVLRDGAVVGINVGRNSIGDITDSEMYAISHNGQLRIKQAYRLPAGIRFRSFNRDEYPDEDYTFQQVQQQEIAIIGHVFWWGMFSR